MKIMMFPRAFIVFRGWLAKSARSAVPAFALLGGAAVLSAATSVSQFGITWTFDGDYTVGQYANGDNYVVAPSGLTIVDISPASTFTQMSSAAVTISMGSPATVTWTAHGLFPGQLIKFSTTGTLPAPLVAGTVYYIASTGYTADAFRIATTSGGAAINTTTAGSGTQTC